jgi:hypothetical protein
VPEDELRTIERWFVARGVPHFVERRPSAWEIWGRATPLLVLAYVLLGLNALDLDRWSWRGNLLVAVLVVAALVLMWVGANLVRGRRPLERPHSIGPVELGLLVLVPALLPALVGQWGDAVQTAIEGVVVLFAVWALTSYGVLPLLSWAWQRTSAQARSYLNLIVRGLPLLLLFMTFLFVNAEVWQVAGTLEGPTYVLVLTLFFLLGCLFLLSGLPPLMRALNTFDSWAEISIIARNAAVVPERSVESAVAGVGDPPAVDRPSMRQRLNLGLVALFSQSIQITATAVAMFGFFVLFGFLAIGADTAAAWTAAGPLDELAGVTFGGRRLSVTEPLLRVAGFLGVFAGMYFTVVLSTDATYREEFSEDLGPELRQALAVRRVYRRALEA